MNPYLIGAIVLGITLIVLVLRDLTKEATSENIEKLYNELGDEGREKADQYLDRLLESNQTKRIKRREKIARILASNQYLWIIAMFVLYKFSMSKDEREAFKKDIVEKYPHLRDAVEGGKWPFN